MIAKLYPTPFADARRAAIHATAIVSSNAERLKRLFDSASNADQQPVPSPFEVYRSRATTCPQGQVLPTQGPACGGKAAHDLSVFNELNFTLPVPVSKPEPTSCKSTVIVTRDQLAQMLNISPRWAAELGRTGVFPRVGKNKYDATDLLSRWIAYKFS